MKLRAKDFPEFYRDPKTNGIVHDDDAAYQEYRKKKLTKKQEMAQKQAHETRLNNLESEVRELKSGINQILELLKNGTKDVGTKNS